VRTRLLLRDSDAFRYGGELDAADLEDVWRQTEGDPALLGRQLREGDVAYRADVYFVLNGDAGWRSLAPGKETRALYRLITAEERR